MNRKSLEIVRNPKMFHRDHLKQSIQIDFHQMFLLTHT